MLHILLRISLPLLLLGAVASCAGFDIPDSYPSGVIEGTEYTTEAFELAPDVQVYERNEVRDFVVHTDRSALRALEQCLPGTVIVEFMVAPDGRPVNVRIIEAHPPRSYDEAAFRALQASRFEPTVVDRTWQPERQRRPIAFDVPDHCNE